MPLDFITDGTKDKVIVLIHGLFGSKKTWIPKDTGDRPSLANNYNMGLEPQPLLTYLEADEEIRSHFDFAIFSYYTRPIQFFYRIKWARNLLGKTDIKRNLPIGRIVEVLTTEIEVQLKASQYKSIILIAHSMGGIIAKAYILDQLDNKKGSRVKLFISLAVPHQGSDFATLGKAFLKNPQVKYLAPLSGDLQELNQNWINNSHQIPHTVYFVGTNDTVVVGTAAIGHQVGKKDLKYLEHDHFSIIKPKKATESLVIYIKKKIGEQISSSKIKNSPSKEDIPDPVSAGTAKTQFLINQKNTENDAPLPGKSKTNHPMEDEIQKIKRVLTRDLGAGIRKLKNLIDENSKDGDTLLQIEGRYLDLQSKKIGGVLDYSTEQTETNRIRRSLLELISTLDYTNPPISPPPPLPDKSIIEQRITSLIERLAIDYRLSKENSRDADLIRRLDQTRKELKQYLIINQYAIQNLYSKEELRNRINPVDLDFNPGDGSVWIFN